MHHSIDQDIIHCEFHVCVVALARAMSVCLLVHHFVRWIANKIGHGSQRMNPTDFGDPLTYHIYRHL